MKTNNKEIPFGYKDSPLGVIPQEWEVKRIKDVIKYIGGGAFSSKDATGSGVRWLKIANVGINEIKWDEESFLPESYLQEYPELLLRDGDIVMALTRPILDKKLKIAIITKEDSPALLNQRVAKVQTKEDGCEMFFFYCLQMPKFIAEMESDMLGTDPPNASFDNMYKQKIAVPPLGEQERIAEVLGTWDRAIELQGRKVALLQSRKRALMQQLLTPHRRLPNFSEPWKTTKLGEIAERVTRKNTENNLNVMIISAQRGFVSQTDFFNKSIASEITDNYFLVHKDEFCYNKSYCNGYPMGAIKRLNSAEKAV